MFGSAANNGQMIAEISASHRTTEMFLQIAQRLTGRGETKKPRGVVPVAPDREAAGEVSSPHGVPSCLVSVAEQKATRGPAKPAGCGAGTCFRRGRRCRARPRRRPSPSPPLAPASGRRRRRRWSARRSDNYYQVKATIFGALIEAIDLAQLAKLDGESAREEIRDIVNEIIAIKNIVMSIAEQEELLDDICNDVLGYGPLEPLLSRDDIADIMVNGAGTVFIEVAGKIQRTGIRFRDNQQLLNICQRIVSQVGRRVDESSPICDARLADGSRVNAIVPPLAIDGPALTIRKFKKDKLTLDQLVKFGAISPEGAEILQIIGRCRGNVLISGGTGSGKTTLLNCLTNYIDARRARHHLRRRRRTAAAAAACGAPGNPPAQHRGRRPGHHARTGPQLPAYAARTHHRRRSPRTRGVRPAAGHEHRP